jgi:hypothetical protein
MREDLDRMSRATARAKRSGSTRRPATGRRDLLLQQVRDLLARQQLRH